MRFVYIVTEDSIDVEIQKYRERLSPFIRSKSIVSGVNSKLKLQADKNISIYLSLLKSIFPPYKIPRIYLTKDIVNEIEKSKFIFERKSKNGSLERLKTIPKRLYDIPRENESSSVVFDVLQIYIEGVKRIGYDVRICAKSKEYSIEIPPSYNLNIPLIDRKTFASIDVNSINALKEKFGKWCGLDLENKILSDKDLKELNNNKEVNIKYISNRKNKSVHYVSRSLFKVGAYQNIDLTKEEVKYYNDILIAYLNEKKYVEYNDKVIFIDDELTKNFIEKLDSRILQKLFSDDVSCNDFIRRISSIDTVFNKNEVGNKLKDIGFNAELKEYQKEGVSWLLNLYFNDVEGCLLADEMGLGKTIQLISFLLISNVNKILIIVPASLIHNWENELRKFTNYYENDISISLDKDRKICIISYEFARSKIHSLQEIQYDVLVLDESQKIKNVNTQIFSSIKHINRKFTVIMTGTPVENSLDDLWTMLYAVKADLHSLYVNKVAKLLLTKESYTKAISLTIKLLHPIILQREKKDVLNLPKRVDKRVFIEFSKDEKLIYEKLVNIFASSLSSGLSGRVQTIALEGLLRLRQYCSIHSTIPDSLISTRRVVDSKMEHSKRIIELCISVNEKIVIFSQFTKTLDVIQTMLDEQKYKYVRLDGSMSKQKRKYNINKFQNNQKYNVFLVSLRAGGVGLNLTSARNALLFEPWWNPAVEEQAFSRIDRIGQENNITIYRLIYKDSVEEKIETILENKKEIYNDLTSMLINIKSMQSEITKEIFGI